MDQVESLRNLIEKRFLKIETYKKLIEKNNEKQANIEQQVKTENEIFQAKIDTCTKLINSEIPKWNKLKEELNFEKYKLFFERHEHEEFGLYSELNCLKNDIRSKLKNCEDVYDCYLDFYNKYYHHLNCLSNLRIPHNVNDVIDCVKSFESLSKEECDSIIGILASKIKCNCGYCHNEY
jgi:hypothetical protein